MSYKSDIEIAQSAEIRPIGEIAQKLDIPQDALELYGSYKAKINVHKLPAAEKQGKVIVIGVLGRIDNKLSAIKHKFHGHGDKLLSRYG